MNRKFFCFIVFLFSSFTVFASEILIAPIAVYDSNGDKTSVPNTPDKAIYTELEKHWFEGLINFSCLREKNYGIPVSIIDANKICISESVDYLIYGYVKKNETSWNGEVKLYDAANKKIIKEFFASDSIEQYDRFINVLCQNVLSGIEEISGLNKNDLKKNETRLIELYIPVSLFYWTPIDSGWGSRILGIAGLSTGLEFFLPQPIMVTKGNLIDFSARFNLAWDIGINKKTSYPLILNTVEIGLPVILHLHFNEFHSLYGGLGLAYNIELMSIRPKYEDKQFLYQNVLSFETVAGYEFAPNEKIKLFSEIVFTYHMLGDGFVSIKSSIGVSFNVFKEQR